MSMSDPVADLLTRVRNAQAARHDDLAAPSSRLRVAITRILKEEGFITDFQVEPGTPRDTIHIQLRYDDHGKGMILGIERDSRPGRRQYVGVSGIPQILGGLGTVIMSTNKGVITGKRARQLGVGGEVLCRVW